MMAAAEIAAALAVHNARLVVEGDRIQVTFPSDRPPPSDLIEAAKANRESLRALLLAKPGHRYSSMFSAIRAKCPAYVEIDRWQQAVEDAGRFLATWGEQAEALGWTSRELFGLHTPTERPTASYQRLSRYDETGLVWLLQGRPVIALTADTAAVQTTSGGTLTYRKYNKPELGPLGDSLDDFDGAA
jgi:hypothetical protein